MTDILDMLRTVASCPMGNDTYPETEKEAARSVLTSAFLREAVSQYCSYLGESGERDFDRIYGDYLRGLDRDGFLGNIRREVMTEYDIECENDGVEDGSPLSVAYEILANYPL